MSRTTSRQVQGILADHYDGLTSLNPFIDTAHSLTNKVAAADSNGELEHSDLELIERWLAAHAYAHADQIMSSKSTGGASGSFQGQTAMMFQSTQYGQMALALDITGYLARLQQEAQTGGRKRVGMAWLGTRYRDDYSERASDQ